MRRINQIVVHCSASNWGNAKVIDEWHKERGWSGIGYHFVIGNGYPSYNSWRYKKKQNNYDGLIEIGRPIDRMGAHAKGDNAHSIGVCLIGNKKFNLKPLYVLLHTLCMAYQIGPARVLGHYEVKSGIEQGKTCPNFDMAPVREKLVYLLLDNDGLSEVQV